MKRPAAGNAGFAMRLSARIGRQAAARKKWSQTKRGNQKKS